MSWRDLGAPGFQWIPAVLCVIFALLMQVDANFINDYYDCIRGVDGNDRLGPERACQQGWITLPAMKRGIWITTAISCMTGLPLILWGGWSMVLVGIACVVFCFLYTTLLARLGLGDALVLVFFGLVPVAATYYLQTQQINSVVLLLGLAIGLVTDCLLLVNNYRDRETDVKHNKHTLVTTIGEKPTEWLYLFCGIIACVLVYLAIGKWALVSCCIYLPPHLATWSAMKRIHKGKALNSVLGKTAFNILLFGICLTLQIYIMS